MALPFDHVHGRPAAAHFPGERAQRAPLPVWAWRAAGILFLIGVEAVLYGFSYPFFSLALEKFGLSNWLIGLNASLAGAGILIIGPFLPWLIRLFGLRSLVAGLFTISLLSFGAILVTESVFVWFVARFIMGACFAALWSTTEIWLNGVVDDRHRGRIIGAAGTLYAGAQFLGPLSLSITGVTGALPLIAAMLPLAAGVIVALMIRSPAGHSEEAHLGAADGFTLAIAIAGSLIALSFMAGVLETSMQSLLPLFALAHGLSDAGASQMMAVFSLGEAVLVAAVGFMADRYGRNTTMKLCIVPVVAVMIAMPASVFAISLLGPILFIAGGAISGVYTLGVIQIGHNFRGQRLAVVSTAFAMAYAAGAVVGSAPMGFAIDVFGTTALPIMISCGFLALAALIAYHTSGADRASRTARQSTRASARQRATPHPVTVTQDLEPVQAVLVGEPANGDHEIREYKKQQEHDLQTWFQRRASELAQRRALRERTATERRTGVGGRTAA